MLTLTGVFSYSVFTAQAYSFFSDQAVAKDCFNCGACSLCDLLLIASKGMRFLLSLCGAIALALFIYGGFELLISQGKAEAVEHGKKMITGTVIGVFIILLVAWVWPNWVIISLKGIPTEGKPATIFSNDAWWITPCREYKATEKCATPATLSPLTGTSADTCVKVNEQGVPVGFEESGTSCNECANHPCVCRKDLQACVSGCVTVDDCKKLDKEYNKCSLFPIGGRGICITVTPGDACTKDEDCPVYVYEENVALPLNRTGFVSKTRESEMYCETSRGQCYIKENESCESIYANYCALPHTECKYDLVGLGYECKRTDNRPCHLYSPADTSKCTAQEQCLVNDNGQKILCPTDATHRAANRCTCQPKYY